MPRIAEQESMSESKLLAVLTTSHFTQHLYIGVAVLYPIVMKAIGITYTELGIAVGVASIATGFLQLGFIMFARYVPRRVLLGLGNALLSAGAATTGLARSFYHLVAANFVGAIGTAAQHPIGVSIISDKFSRKSIGGALGFHYGLAYIGNIVSPLVLTTIAITLGWRPALYLIALPPALTSLMLILFLRRESSAGKTTRQSSLRGDIGAALKEKEAMIVIASQGLLAGGTGQGPVVTYTPLFLANGLHLDSFQTGVLFSVMMVGGVLGPVLMGMFSSRIGYLKTTIINASIASASTYIMTLFSDANFALALNLFIMGISGFAVFSLLQAHLSLIPNYWLRDMVLGLFFMVAFGFSSVWSIAIGSLIDLYHSFVPAYILMSILSLFATALLFKVKR